MMLVFEYTMTFSLQQGIASGCINFTVVSFVMMSYNNCLLHIWVSCYIVL